MKARPLQDRVLVRLVEEDATSAAGIVLPDSAKLASGQVISEEVGLTQETTTIEHLGSAKSTRWSGS